MQLLICCARVEMVEPFHSHIQQIISAPIDWNALLPLAARHGMIALLNKHLSALESSPVPTDFVERLRKQNKALSARQLFLTARVLKISQLLNEANIPHLHYKGIVLDHLLYGGHTLRPTSDMDILVRKEDVMVIKEMLIEEGYKSLHIQDINDHASEEVLLSRHKDYVFLHSKNNHMVEVHWKLTTPEVSTKFDWSYFRPAFQTVTLQGLQLHTFNKEEVYQTLCMHGARHQFEQLRWICDLAQLTTLEQDLDWSLILKRSEEAGVKRMVLLGTHLVVELMGIQIPSLVQREIDLQKGIKPLGVEVCQLLTVDDTSAHKTTRYAFEIRLLDHWLQRLKYVTSLLSTLTSREVNADDTHPIRGIYRYCIRAYNIIRRRGLSPLLTTLSRMVRATRS